MRPLRPLHLLSLLAALGMAAPSLAGDEVDSTRYLGLAVTYQFGGNTGSAVPAGLSFGSLQLSGERDLPQQPLHLPLFSVPLAQHGVPVLAPIEALSGVLKLFDRKHGGEQAGR